MRILHYFLAGVAAFAGSVAARASAPVTMSVRAGTLGVGPEVDVRLPDSDFGVRVNADMVEFGVRDVYRDNLAVSAYGIPVRIPAEFSGSIKSMTAGAVVDYYPNHTGFRLSAGVIAGDSRLSASATPNDAILPGGGALPLSGYGSIHGKVTYKRVAPYLGIGFSERLISSLYLSGDLGVIYQGTGDVSLWGEAYDNVPESARADLVDDLKRIRGRIQGDLGRVPVYPILMVGLGWRL